MKQLLKEVNEIVMNYEKEWLHSGNNFNVFEVLNITSDEVRLHSKFIAELLNPKGSHGQGYVFLELFMKELGIETFDAKTASVTVEKYIGKVTKEDGGRIDIIIEDNSNNSIIIENKIYAKDQENQLLRYHNFQKKYNHKHLYYLELTGEAPNPISYGDLQIGKDFILISYSENVSAWLIECMKKSAEMHLLREGIHHYLQLINLLTNKSTNNKMAKTISDLLIASPQNLKNAVEIHKSINLAKIEIQWMFWEEIRKQFNEKGIKFIDYKGNASEDKVKKFYNKSEKEEYGFWCEIAKINDLTFYYFIKLDHNIFYGFSIEKKGQSDICNNPAYKNYRSMVLELNPEYRVESEWSLGWKYPDVPLDFKAFNSEAIFELADKELLRKQVEAIVLDSITDINRFKEELNKI